MLSDDELLDHDTSDSIFAKETPWEDSPRTFTRHLINRFGISSKGGLRLSSIIPKQKIIIKGVAIVYYFFMFNSHTMARFSNFMNVVNNFHRQA